MTKRKKIVLFICSLALSFQVFTSTALADSLYLNVEGITQQEDEWCWAASDKCVIDYLKGTYPTQSELVAWMFGSPPPDQAATLPEMQDVLAHYNVTSTLNNASVSFATLKNNISGWYSPMIAALSSNFSNTGHAVVIYGYNETSTSQTVSYMDPAYNSGYWWQSETYGYFSSNLFGSWVGTLYYNH